MEKYIHVTKEVRESLAKVFGTTRMSVWRALHFVNDTPMSKKIRKVARDKGGLEMAVLPYMETFHDHDGFMRQYLPNGVLVECDKNTGCVEIIKDGEAVAHWDDVRMDQLSSIQQQASRL